jgi:sensor histidine kinase YesM
MYAFYMSDFSEKEAIKTLEKLGYKVKLSKPTVKKTFEIEIELLEKFIEIQKKRKLKMKEAIHEVFFDWVRKKE